MYNGYIFQHRLILCKAADWENLGNIDVSFFRSFDCSDKGKIEFTRAGMEPLWMVIDVKRKSYGFSDLKPI